MARNKLSFRFLVASLVYIAIITFLLLTQPRSGYSVSVTTILLQYLLFVPLWTTICILTYVNIKAKEQSLIKKIFSQQTLFVLLLISIVTGFVFNLDFIRTIGCFSFEENAFSPIKIALSSCSLFLVIIGYYLSDKRIGAILLIIEFFIWTTKSLYYNGSLDLLFIGYFTMTTWLLRVILIVNVIKLRQDNESQTHKI